MKTVNLKFDVTESEDAFELHGELPGVEQKDVEIEFTDAQTISVKGCIERSYHTGTPPADLIDAPNTSGAIEEAKAANDHKATVEDENATAASTEIIKAEVKGAKSKEPTYWVSERSVGEFSRSFTFPVRVDQEAVQASMKHGILSIIVPKAKKYESRKITIS